MSKRQPELIEEVDWDYIVICDGGRADIFSDIFRDYFSDVGEYKIVNNGDVSYTATWFSKNFPSYYDVPFFCGGLPIYAFRENPPGYDEREHFSFIPDWEMFEWGKEYVQTSVPSSITEVVSRFDFSRGVIRYLQPHNPYRKLPDVANREVARKYDSEILREAYLDNYRWVLEEISENLIDIINGRIIITSDHGQGFGEECCGQYLHNQNHEKCWCLTEVPWLELEIDD